MCAENGKDQCQEQITHDLTRTWPMPGELRLVGCESVGLLCSAIKRLVIIRLLSKTKKQMAVSFDPGLQLHLCRQLELQRM